MATATIVPPPPFPPFFRETAVQKVRLAEEGWNSRDPGKVALAYAIDSRWRNRSEFINGRNEIIASSFASGSGSWTTDLSRCYGRSPTIELLFASLTSGMMIRATGI